MATRMQQRRGTAQQWTDANPILAAGEIGFEIDTNQFKIGDGTNQWADLSYFKNLEDLGGSFDDYIAVTEKGEPNGVATLDANGLIPVAQLEALVDSAPEVLDTLAELASAITSNTGLVNTAIQDAIALEAAARLAADEANADSIAAEVTAREQADTSLGTQITNLQTTFSNNIDEAIAGEVTARNTQIASDISAHNADTTNVHGIADTAVLATFTDVSEAVSDHNAETLNVHGISDTAALATKTGTETLTNKTIDTANNSITVVVADISDVTASAAELNVLDGITATTAELNYVDGVTSNVQTQLDAKAPLANPTFTGTLNAAAVSITGDLTIGGTTTTVNAQDLVVNDPLIYIGEDNTSNVVDLGVVASFNDGSYQHTGIVRDATDGKWKLFSSVEDEPTTTVNFAQAVYDTLRLGAVEFSDGTQSKQGVPSLTEINQQTAAYTTVLSDRDKLVEVNSSSAVTVTIPTDASVNYPVGTSFDILQTGSGQVTIAGAGGVTVNATPGLKLRTQWSSATVFKRAANTWVVYGDLSA